jgi:hypothetical protein
MHQLDFAVVTACHSDPWYRVHLTASGISAHVAYFHIALSEEKTEHFIESK